MTDTAGGTGEPAAAGTFDRRILERPTLDAARALIGARLVHDDDRGRRAGTIVEVEAYIGEDDLASHARFGRTARNAVMYGPAGTAYVYLVYGMYDCLNVVTEPAPQPAAILIRAVESIEGVDAMRASRLEWHARRRRTASEGELERERARLARIPDGRLASGPGLVCAAFAIDRAMTGLDLCDPASPLRLEAQAGPRPATAASRRIGVDYAGEEWAARPWRLYLPGNPAVSGRPR